MGAIALTSNPIFHARTKHVEVDYHFIREKVLEKVLCVDYIPTEHQVADMFTKPLCTPHFQKLKSQLPLFSFAARCYPEGHHLEGGCQNLTANMAKHGGTEEDIAENTATENTVTEQEDENTAIAAIAAGCDSAATLGYWEQIQEECSGHNVAQTKSPRSSKELMVQGAEMNQNLDAELGSQLQPAAVVPAQSTSRVMKLSPWWKLHSLLTQKIPKE